MKASLKQGEPFEALKYTNSCFSTLKKQLGVLNELLEVYNEEKISKIIEKKGKML